MSGFTIRATREGREGVGARVDRAFPVAERDHFDPFVLLDDFTVGTGGVPEHEHRGFEIITYMLDGALEHSDSTGISETANAGGAMRMRTASGMRHAEFPGTDEPAHGLQLWVNLPRDEKELDPDYRDAERDQLPVDARDGMEVTTVVGEGSPLDLRAEVRYEVVEAAADTTYEWAVAEGWSAVLYVVEGAVAIPTGTIEQRSFAARDGSERAPNDLATIPVEIREDATFAVIAGNPLDEPISQRGPVVL